MRAVQLITPGHPLEDRDLDPPTPGPGEVVTRVEAAGICRSDLHYRSGFPLVSRLPLTLGHEVAGTVVETGPGVAIQPGSRVCLHYLVTCGTCGYCRGGVEQFCAEGAMLGKDRDGGWADYVVVPESNVVPVPDGVSTRAAAVMMCSTATSYHAMRVSGVGATTTVALFGLGGLGQSAAQLARWFGADVIAVDPDPAKRELAASFGATAVDPGEDPVAAVLVVAPDGVDVAIDLVGSAAVMESAVAVLAPMGRAVAVGLTAEEMSIGPYTDLVTGERAVMGSSDHLVTELPELLALAAEDALDIDGLVTRSVPLTADAINGVLDDMASWGSDVRTVVERA